MDMNMDNRPRPAASRPNQARLKQRKVRLLLRQLAGDYKYLARASKLSAAYAWWVGRPEWWIKP